MFPAVAHSAPSNSGKVPRMCCGGHPNASASPAVSVRAYPVAVLPADRFHPSRRVLGGVFFLGDCLRHAARFVDRLTLVNVR